jgi:hypothetical protein
MRNFYGEMPRTNQNPIRCAADEALYAEMEKKKATMSQMQAGMQSSNAPSPERIPEVARHIDALFTNTDRASERIAGLENRLCSVLTPRPPDDCNKAESENLTLLGSQLLSLNLRIHLMIEALDSITSRLEL